MTDREIGLCNGIIHTASLAAAGVGGSLAQLPTSDTLVITPIQITMIISLGGVFGIALDESVAKAELASATAGMVGRSLTQWLIGWLPGVGNIINATTAAALTETIGWTVAKDFERRSG